MKLKLPANANVREANHGGFPRTIVKMPRQMGWDIANIIARENKVSMVDLAKISDMSVYLDHVIVDTACVG